MLRFRARVQNGRLLVDEPTDLPDGSEWSLLAEELEPLSAAETERLRGIAKGTFRTTDEVRLALAARRG